MPHPLADYLHELYLISGVSVPETSGYPSLSKLLNAVGDSLKPKITAVILTNHRPFALWTWLRNEWQTG